MSEMSDRARLFDGVRSLPEVAGCHRSAYNTFSEYELSCASPSKKTAEAWGSFAKVTRSACSFGLKSLDTLLNVYTIVKKVEVEAFSAPSTKPSHAKALKDRLGKAVKKLHDLRDALKETRNGLELKCGTDDIKAALDRGARLIADNKQTKMNKIAAKNLASGALTVGMGIATVGISTVAEAIAGVREGQTEDASEQQRVRDAAEVKMEKLASLKNLVRDGVNKLREGMDKLDSAMAGLERDFGSWANRGEPLNAIAADFQREMLHLDSLERDVTSLKVQLESVTMAR